MAETLLTLQNLSKYYTSPQSVVVGLDRISLSFSRGEFVAVTGESGSGKSTLAHVLGGILPYESGELLLSGRPTSHYGREDWERYRLEQVSFISQSYGILPGSTALSNVVSALRLAGLDRAQARREAEAVLRKVELWEYRNRRAAKLSSGQKQRLSIARALAKPAPILIADEPTGNLDGENSAKIISLLAEAAKERLVILITHEFGEAKDHVTRHISLQDGRVTMDARLREGLPPSLPSPAKPATKKRRDLSGCITGLQLRSRPVWSVFMLFFFALTLFAVFAFAGTYIVALDDTSTRLYDDSGFQNGDSRRIVVCRADGMDMTAEDEAALLSVEHVENLERYRYLLDIKYAWQEEVDYRWRYTVDWAEGAPHLPGSAEEVEAVMLIPDEMSFAKTVPLFADGREFLTAGRLPESTYEVVIAGDESLLGQVFPVYFQDCKNWGSKYFVYIQATVVGVTNYGSGLYFHEDIGEIFTADLITAGEYLIYMPATDDLPNDEVRLQKEAYEWNRSRRGENFSITLADLDDIYDKDLYRSAICVGSHLSTHPNAVEVSPAVFEELSYEGHGGQVSLMMEDYAYTDRVLADLYELGYAALSPYREGSVTQVAELAAQRMQTLRICLIALVVVLALQVVVLRAMFGLEVDSYRLLSHIGLDAKAAKRSLLWQVLLFAVFGQALGLLAIRLCGLAGIESVGRLLRYLPLPYAVLLSAIHLIASLAAALWVMGALRRQVYPDDRSVPDLDWSEYDKEVGA